MSQITHILYKPQDAPPQEEGYTRLPLQTAQLLAGHGIEGDTKGGGAIRHLNIMTKDVQNALAEEGFQTQPGQLGEQLIVEGLDVNALPLGTRLQLGESAVVELVEPRTGCAKFERYQEKQREETSGRLGMIAKVIASGAIAVGDKVCVAHDSNG
jgi:MOSC domain-containing protein YiiM